jgi:virginiamycin B lyase
MQFDAAGPIGNAASPWTFYAAGGDPIELALDNAGNVWYTETDANQVASMTSLGVVTQHTAPAGGSGLTYGPDGNIWIADNTQIVRLTPSNDAVTTYSFNGHAGDFESIAPGPDQTIWFASKEAHGSIGRIDMSGNLRIFYRNHPGQDEINGIVEGPEGKLMWFASKTTVGEINYNGTIKEYVLPRGSGAATGITVGPDNKIWFVDTNHEVGQVTLDGAITVYKLPEKFHANTAQIASARGSLWLTGSLPDAFEGLARISTSGQVAVFRMPFAIECCGNAIVGGPNGALWFSAPEASGEVIGTRAAP